MIDTSKWKEFKVSDLFTIKRGERIVHDVDYFDEQDETYKYPVITTTSTDNGVDGFYSETNCGGNCIISGGEANGMYTTYQPEPCWALDTVRVYRPFGFKMTPARGLFLATLLKENMYRFSYGRKAKPDNMYMLDIKLPTNQLGYPDWDWIDAYMGGYLSKPLKTSVSGLPMPLAVEKWGEFKLGDLFEIVLSEGDIKADEMDDGVLPLVSSGETNNGVVKQIAKDGDGKAKVFPGNVITLDMFGKPFYQPEPFYAVSHGRVNILIPRFNLNARIGLFLCTIIGKEQFKYSYGRAIYSSEAKRMKVRLPAKSASVPDWQFMDNYIKSLPYSDLLQ